MAYNGIQIPQWNVYNKREKKDKPRESLNTKDLQILTSKTWNRPEMDYWKLGITTSL